MFKRGKLLECPFTWDINEELSAHHNDASELPVTMKDQPAIALMNGLMAVYCSTMQRDYEKAKRKIIEVDELRDSMNLEHVRLTKENISPEVLNHIIWSTIFHVRGTTQDDLTAIDVAFDKINKDSRKRTPKDFCAKHGKPRSLFCEMEQLFAYASYGQTKELIQTMEQLEVFDLLAVGGVRNELGQTLIQVVEAKGHVEEADMIRKMLASDECNRYKQSAAEFLCDGLEHVTYSGPGSGINFHRESNVDVSSKRIIVHYDRCVSST